MENDSTPPTLANVGLHSNRRMTETRKRRFKEPKKLEASSSDDELFVSRPKFKKTILDDDQEIKQKEDENLVIDDQEIKQEGEENLLMDDQEKPNEPMDPRLVNFMMGSSSTKWLNHEFGNLTEDEAKSYDFGTFLDEACPQLQTRLLPRRGWQMIRRSLGRARRFSQVFIQEELKGDSLAQQSKDPPVLEKGLPPLCEPLPQDSEDSPALEEVPSPLSEAIQQEPMDSPVEYPYSDKLLESIITVRKLVATKRNILLEIALKNEEIEANQDSGTWRSSQHRETMQLYQRCFSSLYCVNDDIVAPMTVLHEHLEQYRREVAENGAGACSPLEIYRKCLHKAELDLKSAERNKSLYTPDTRDLHLKLRTIMLIMSELGGPNSVDLLSIVDSLFSQLSQSLPPEASAQLKQSMDELEPYLRSMKELFINRQNREPAEDMQ